MGAGFILDFTDTGTEPSYIESTVVSKGTDRKDPQLILKK